MSVLALNYDGPTRAHPRVGKVRFRGAPSLFGPLRATVAQQGDLRAGGAMPVYASQHVLARGSRRRSMSSVDEAGVAVMSEDGEAEDGALRVCLCEESSLHLSLSLLYFLPRNVKAKDD